MLTLNNQKWKHNLDVIKHLIIHFTNYSCVIFLGSPLCHLQFPPPPFHCPPLYMMWSNFSQALMTPLLSAHCKIDTHKSSCNCLSFFHNNKQMGLLSLLESMEDFKSWDEKIVDHEHAMKEKTTQHREHWFHYGIDNILNFPS